MTYMTIDLDSLGRNDITRGQSPNGYKNQRQDRNKIGQKGILVFFKVMNG